MSISPARIYVSTVAEDAVETAARHGFGLEIAEFCTAMNMDAPAFTEWDDRVRRKLESLAAQRSSAGIKAASADAFPARASLALERGRASPDQAVDNVNVTFHAPFNELCPSAIEPRVLDVARVRYREAAALAKTYGATRMVVHSGYVPLVYFKEYFIERSVEFWTELIRDLPDGLDLMLENVLEDAPELTRDIAKAVDSPRLKLCLDVGHANCIVSDVPLAEWIDCCAPHLGHVHIHNNYRDWDHHNALGDGIIDMDAALNQLSRLAPDATYTIESIESKPSGLWLETHGFLMKD
ncbi:MAG: sugar phosphate isomerase/epimerase [Oscillospiraceae bacterium]|jgi:endonuclease IV|nr:sugar phosphate isomerase/epimerase [Oscillospiraceae bacterium]